MKFRNLIVAAVVLLAVFGMLLTVAELPPYGRSDNPGHNLVLNVISMVRWKIPEYLTW